MDFIHLLVSTSRQAVSCPVINPVVQALERAQECLPVIAQIGWELREHSVMVHTLHFAAVFPGVQSAAQILVWNEPSRQ